MKNTIVINGKVYDAITGLPVARPIVPHAQSKVQQTTNAPSTKSAEHAVKVHVRPPAKQVHKTIQKSATLRRDILKKPIPKAGVQTLRRKSSVGHVQKSPMIHRFAEHPQPIQHTVVHKKVSDEKPEFSHIIAQTHKKVAQHSKSTQPMSRKLVTERLARVSADEHAQTKAKKPKKHRQLAPAIPRTANMIAASLAVMLLGGYLTYINMPGLSVRVASSQAGISAVYPDYQPDGYSFDGPVAYAPGQVAINFKANGSSLGYTITEQKSTWDSQAVYDNIVAKSAKNNHTINSQQGLTIYTYGNSAVWVNRGVLYTIKGSALLDNRQLLRIAGSL